MLMAEDTASNDSEMTVAKLHTLETEIWQNIVEFVRGESFSEIIDIPVDLSYPVRVNLGKRNFGDRILSIQSLANIR